MKGIITVGGVGGDGLLNKGIELFSAADYMSFSHIFIMLGGGTLEALGEREAGDTYAGVWVHNKNKYKGNPYARFFEVEVPDYESAYAKAGSLVGKPYGYFDCIRTLYFNTFGTQCDIMDETAMDCSETATRIMRAGGLDILPGIIPGCVDPTRFIKAIREDCNGKDVTGAIGDGAEIEGIGSCFVTGDAC